MIGRKILQAAILKSQPISGSQLFITLIADKQNYEELQVWQALVPCRKQNFHIFAPGDEADTGWGGENSV